jgi:hypothetical protein
MADDPNTPPQGGGGGGNPAPEPDLAKAIKGLLDRHGDPNAALRVVLDENYRYRDQLRDLKAKVPGEADVVLTGDDAKRWASYRELGDPGDLKKTLKAAADDRADVERFRRAEVYDEAATLARFNAKAFRRLAEADGLAVTIEADKKGERVPHVKGVDDKGQEALTPLTQYAETHWAEFLPSLQGGERQEPQRPNGTPRGRNPNGPPPPPGEKGDPIEQHIRRSGIVSF